MTNGRDLEGKGDSRNGAGGIAARLGLKPGQLVQEIGWDEDVDEAVRADIESATGTPLVDADAGEIVDVVLLWWRDGDGDLVDGLVDALTDLDKSGSVWLLTPRFGQPLHVAAAEVADAAPTAGLGAASAIDLGGAWQATHLTPRRKGRA